MGIRTKPKLVPLVAVLLVNGASCSMSILNSSDIVVNISEELPVKYDNIVII